MDTIHYDNIIIGFGKGGKTLAKFLSTHGETVALIEKSSRMYGGTCINIGCIPSKSLIVNGEKHLTFPQAAQKKAELTGKLNQKNYHMIADEVNAKVIDGHARFLSDTQIEVNSQVLTAEKIFINTGATPVLPSIKGLDVSKNLVTSTELLDLTELPERLVIIGAGYIGLEFANMFQQYGCKVIVLDGAPNFLPREDEDISQRILTDMMDYGIEFHLAAKITEVQDNAVLITDKEGIPQNIPADKILIATGRRANTDNLGLENTSVEVDTRGAIIVNEKLETSAPNIWAIGDVHGGLQFTYTSLDDFRIIKNQLFGDKTKTLNNRGFVPTSVFINPTLSNVGLTEKTAKEQGIDYKLFKLEAAGIPKSLVLSQPKGLMKALVDPKTNQILGATFYSEESHELINLIVLAMKAKVPYTVLRDQIFTHPTMSEALNDLFA